MMKKPLSLSGIAAVLFDFDGTLVLTEEIGPNVFASVLTSYGVPHESWADRFAAVWQRTDTSLDLGGLFDLALNGIADSTGAMLEFRRQFATNALLAPESRGATPLLSELKALRIVTAVVSHAPSQDLLPQLNTRNWNNQFSVVFPYERFTAPKPDPSCYLDVLTELNVMAESTVVFEDSSIGLEAARRAGIRAIHVGCSDTMNCKETSAVAHIEDLADVRFFQQNAEGKITLTLSAGGFHGGPVELSV